MRLRTPIAALLLILGLVFGVASAAAAPQYPDLVSDPPESPFIETYNDGSGERLLLRMDGFVHNAGPGPLDVRGNPQVNVFQRIRDNVTGTFTALSDPLPVIFETNDQHDHFHLMKASEYSLWNAAKTALVAPSEKVGFCLYDLDRVEPVGPANPVYDGGGDFCRSGLPNATTLSMGVSAGWRDVYGAFLEFQWVDISSTPPGSYWLSAASDPDDSIAEANELNNGRAYMSSPTVVPGYVAQAVGPLAISHGTPTAVTLSATTFSDPPGAVPGAKGFRIVDPPDHGTLNRATGVNFAATAGLTYTPAAGYSGPDSFSYVAVDMTSNYPTTPPQASVSLTVADPPTASVAISGAPSSLETGAGVQLTATVANATDQGVTWAVDGTIGGSTSKGTISTTGFYTAPASVPAGGSVTIRATSTAAPAAFDEESIQITAAPVPSVAISGAPSSLMAGAGAQLAATVINATPTDVTWAVNGTTGGSASTGTISASGLYTAPGAVPLAGEVTIRATSVAAPTAFDEVVIQITPIPVVVGVAISGAPASLVASTSAQLSATVTGAAPGVTWAVNGVPGGSAPTGTISDAGLYTAPATVPAGGSVTIRATSVVSPAAFAEQAIAITPAPEPVAAPRPEDAPKGGLLPAVAAKGARPAPTGSRRATLKGRTLTVRVVPNQTGPLVVRAISRGRVLLRCTVMATRGRPLSCSRRLPKGTRVGTIVVRLAHGQARNAEMGRPRTELGRDGWLSATVVPGVAGTVAMRVESGGKTLLRCTARGPAHRPLSCSRHLHHQASAPMRVVATLTSPGRRVIVRY